MNKFYFLLIFALTFSFTAIGAKEKMPSKNIIQVQVVSEDESFKMESKINKFLIERKITRDNLIDIKFARSEGYRTSLIIYEVELEEAK